VENQHDSEASHLVIIPVFRTHNPLVLGSNPSGPTNKLLLQSVGFSASGVFDPSYELACRLYKEGLCGTPWYSGQHKWTTGAT
jgi:hypothetical protein